MADCLFCKIVAGEIPSTRVDEDERTVAFMDINPATRGHVLVVPREHSADLHEIAAEDLQACALAAQRIAARLRDRLDADGVNLAQLLWPRGVADRLPLPRPRDPALRGRPAAAAVDARAGRPRRDRRGGPGAHGVRSPLRRRLAPG